MTIADTANIAPNAAATTTAMPSLTAAQIAQFDRDGYLVVRGVLGPDLLDPIRDAFARAVDQQAHEWFAAGKIADLCESMDFNTRLMGLRRQLPTTHSNSWRRIILSEAVYNVWRYPALLGVVRSLFGADDPLYAHGTWNGRPRVPGQTVQTIDWHQDAHYYPAYAPTEGRIYTTWFPLVPVDAESGCLQVARGSHLGGYRPRVRLERNGLIGLPDADAERYEIITVPMEPGDVLVFHDMCYHRSVDNVANHVRWSLDVRFCNATNRAICEKTRRGYLCFDPHDPARVESYESWSSQYDYEGEF